MSGLIRVLIRATLVLGALTLCACAPTTPTAERFRSQDAPIWSAAAFQPALAAGSWRQVATFVPQGAGCDAGAVRIEPEAGGLRLEGGLCLAGRMQDVSGLAPAVGPGRFAVAGEDWWILWVDTGYRTLVVGTPSGRFGFVLDRGAIPGDRLTAAREILDFNGFSRSGLVTF